MSQINRLNLKNKWVTGYEPTEYDYQDFFDSFYNIIDDEVSSGNLISDTYANISTLVSASGLTVGKMYLITDHATKHLIPNTSTINSGSTEPLILLATSTTKFDNQVYSTIHPEDIIHFDFNNNLCEDSTTPRTGKITYRKDKFNNSCFYDFRNVKFRRWSVDCSVIWASGTTYAKNDLVKYSNIIYQVTSTTNSGNTTTPNNDSLHYNQFLDLTNTSYWLWTDSVNNFNIGNNPNKTNLTIGNYIDCYTFDDGAGNIVNGDLDNNYVYNNEIKFCNSYNVDTFNGDYNNIVFIIANYIYDNIIGYDSMNNTVGNNFYYNTVGNNFYYNTVGNNFQSNTVGNSFQSNTVGNAFYYNTVGNSFQSNTVGTNFYSNTVGTDFYYNTVGNNFYSNTVGNDFQSNTVGNYFYYNTVGNSFDSNTVGNDFNNNTVGNDFNYNTVGNNFNSNTLQDYIENINFIETPYNNHIYSSYNTTILSSSDGSIKVEYIDSNSILTIVDYDGTEHKMGGSGGSGTTGLISDTYANISTLVNTSGLTVGNFYLITDHVTKHVIPNTTVINSGSTEPLILLATSTNKFDNLAYSTVYPDDTIHFDFNNNLCEDNTTPRTGKIIYRKDKFNNSTFYDFRNVKFRRWAVDCSVEWISGSTYAKNDLIKHENIIYQVTSTTNSGNTTIPDSDTLHYCQFLALTSTTYWLWTNTTNKLKLGNYPSKTNLTIGNYIDCYTFDDGSGNIVNGDFDNNQIYNNEIKFCNSSTILDKSYNGDYNNIVFLYSDNSIYNNIIGDNSMNNTIIGNFNLNTVGSGFQTNTVGNGFQYNTVGNDFSSNTIGNDFSSNTIGNDFSSNTIGNECYSNTVGNECYQNTVGNECYSNTIGTRFHYNIIGISFNNNIIGNLFNFNTIGNECYGNTIGYSFYNNIIDTIAWYNIYNNNTNNTFKNMDIIYSYTDTYKPILNSNYKLKANVTLTDGVDNAYFELNYNINNNTLLLISENFITTNTTLYNFNSISIALTDNNFIITDNSSTNIKTIFNVTEIKLLWYTENT